MNHYEILNSQKSDEISAIKNNYHRLALVYHPDLDGGSLEMMQRLNTAWAWVVENHGHADASHPKNCVDDEIVNRAVRIKNACPSVDVVIAGAWIWVSGDKLFFCESFRTALKSEGFKFARSKCAWFFAGCKSYSRVETPLNKIFENYGAQFVSQSHSLRLA